MSLIKKLFFGYQKLAWYVNLAKGEYGKLGSFIPETLMIMTYLTVKGVDIKAWQIPVCYALLMILAAGIGKFLAHIGIVRYNATLVNTHNPELQRILGNQEEILREIKNDEKD